MENLDLCISNYSLEDILDLFKIPNNFTEDDLKQAKRKVLMMHPDKSNLDKEYFFFFSSAYRLLFKVYNFRNRAEQDTCVKREYQSSEMDEELENNHVWKELATHKNFNELFNQLFEKHKNSNGDGDGYGNWLKKEDDFKVAKNRTEMDELINERKQNLRQLVLHKSVSDIGGTSGSSIVGTPDNYQSGVFSDGLQYDDLKQAYTESVVPVTHEDFVNKKRYNSIDSYRRARKSDLDETIANSDHNTRLKEMHEEEGADNMSRAYMLAREDELSRQQRTQWASSLLKITNSK